MYVKKKFNRTPKSMNMKTFLLFVSSLLITNISFGQCKSLFYSGSGISIFCSKDFDKDNRIAAGCSAEGTVLKGSVDVLMAIKSSFKGLGMNALNDQLNSGFKMRCDLNCKRILFETPNKMKVIPKREGSEAVRSILQLDKLYGSKDIEYELGFTLKAELSNQKDGSSGTHLELIFSIRKHDLRDADKDNWTPFEPADNFDELTNKAIEQFGNHMSGIHNIFSKYYCPAETK